MIGSQTQTQTWLSPGPKCDWVPNPDPDMAQSRTQIGFGPGITKIQIRCQPQSQMCFLMFHLMLTVLFFRQSYINPTTLCPRFSFFCLPFLHLFYSFFDLFSDCFLSFFMLCHCAGMLSDALAD